MDQYDGLDGFCTVRQLEFIQAVRQHGSLKRAAKAIGVNQRTMEKSIAAAKRRAALQGYAPEHGLTRPVAPGFMAKGHSTLYRRGEAEPVVQWVKTTRDQQQAEAIIREAIAALMEDVPRVKPIKAPAHTAEDLCNVITLTDCHVGMKAWHRETGADWDLEIAERTLIGAFAHVIEAAPAADTCVIAQLGDFCHFDGMAPVTPTHGHVLDADSRYSKVVGVAVRVLREVCRLALERSRRVILLCSEGNHDPASSVWLRQMFRLLFEAEPRIQVIDSELPYYVHRHGNTMLGWHHGHLAKNEALPMIFAARHAEMWGATKYRYIHVGHRHHVDEKEHPGANVVQHPTIAAPDAYAARGGWISARQITAMTYSAKWGHVARATVTPEMLEAA